MYGVKCICELIRPSDMQGHVGDVEQEHASTRLLVFDIWACGERIACALS